MDECNALRDIVAAAVDVPVLQDVPSERPASFVLVERTGGAMDADMVSDSAVFSLRCWAGSDPAARALCRDVREAVAGSVDADDAVIGSAVTSVYADRDPDTGSPRCTLVCQVTFNV